jgi:hypothetical protein
MAAHEQQEHEYAITSYRILALLFLTETVVYSQNK